MWTATSEQYALGDINWLQLKEKNASLNIAAAPNENKSVRESWEEYKIKYYITYYIYIYTNS